MRVDFYTLECRVFGQAKRAQTRCECTALTKDNKNACIFVESASDLNGNRRKWSNRECNWLVRVR